MPHEIVMPRRGWSMEAGALLCDPHLIRASLELARKTAAIGATRGIPVGLDPGQPA